MQDPENDQVKEKVREELKTDKEGFIKIGDIVMLMIKKGTYCGMISADGVISQSVTVIPRESESDKGANVLTRSCLFRIENANKIEKSQSKKKTELDLKQDLGKPLTYGEKIQFRHLHSSSVISICTQTMAVEAGCLQVSMSEESSEKSWFEIAATNNLRKEGEVIRYSDSVCLVMISNKSHYYLHAEEKNLKNNSRSEVNASGLFSVWMIRRYLNFDLYTDNNFYVRTGDSLRIKHRMTGGYLCTNDSVVQSLCVLEGNLTSNSLWEFQRTTTFFGGSAGWKENFRIKHVATGRFLQETAEGIVLTLKGYEEGTLFSLVPDQEQDDDIRFGSILAIQTQKNRFFNIDESEKVQKKKQKKPLKVSLIVGVKNFTGVAFVLEDVEETKTAHVYKLSLVNPFLEEFNDYASSLPPKTDIFETNIDKAKTFQEKCEDFRNLLNNILEHIILKVSEEVDLQNRQDAIRELGILELVVKISTHIYSKIWYKEEYSASLKKVLEKIYLLLYDSIKSNMRNCKYLFKYESVLLSQLDVGLNLGIGKLLKEIFKNSTVIQSLDEKTFQIWYSFLKPISQAAIKEQKLYLCILQYLCSNNNKGDKKYQSLGLKNIANIQADFTLIKFDYLNKRPVIEFDFPKKNLTLNQFLDKNPELQNLGVVIDEQNFLREQEPVSATFYLEEVSESVSYSSYVSHVIDFLASICMSRFSKAIVQIQNITGITLEHIASVLRNVSIRDELRAAYANLCRVMYVDIDPLVPCSEQKERCYVWRDIEKPNDNATIQRKEVVKPIREIVRFFWDKDGGANFTSELKTKSFKLIIEFCKLASTIIDLQLEDEEFIEFFMQPLCFFIMKDYKPKGHWSRTFIASVNAALESTTRIKVEYHLSQLYLEIIKALDIILYIRQNMYVLNLILFFKVKQKSTEGLCGNFKENFDEILTKLDWDISVKYTENNVNSSGITYQVEKQQVFHMDLYLLELLFDVSGGKNEEIHNSALKVLISDITQRYLLFKELKFSQFLFEDTQVDLYNNIITFGKRLQTTVSLLVQEKDEVHDSSEVNEAIKDSTVIIQYFISTYKSCENKPLFQNLLFHSGVHTFFIKILNLNLSKPFTLLFQVTIAALHIYCKKNKKNQKTLIKHINRLIELIPEISITRLICEILSNKRLSKKGDLTLRSIFEIIDKDGFSIEYSQFLRGFLIDFDSRLIKRLQIRVLKMLFKSEGIKKILGDESQDIFSPQHFLDPALLSSTKFMYHLEVLKIVMACSINNTFGTMQGRRIIPFNLLKHYIMKPEMTYKGKQVYCQFMQLMFFCRIEGEIEPELNINVLDQIIKESLIPDLLKVKTTYNQIIDISRKGGFPLISKNNLRKKASKQSGFAQDVIDYWDFLSQKATWFESNKGILTTFTEIFRQNIMTIDSVMEATIRDLKLVLYEINDLLQTAENQHPDIDFSRYIVEANILREALPSTSLHSSRLGANLSDNIVISALQKYIVENKLSLDDAFKLFDADGSGVIEFEEFRIIIRKLIGNIPSAEIEIAFNHLDQDRSGSLRVAELETIIRKYFSKHPRIVKVKKNDDEASIVQPAQGPEPKIISEEVTNLYRDFCRNFYQTCKEDDMKMLVSKLKEKYMEPLNINLSDSITKLSQVFFKKKHKIYLIRIFKLLLPEFKPKDSIFDERDAEEEVQKKELIRCQWRLSDAGVLSTALELINYSSPPELIEECVQLLISLLKFGNQKNQFTFLNLLKSGNFLFAYVRDLLRETRDTITKRVESTFLLDLNKNVEKTLVLTGEAFVELEKRKEKPKFLVEHLLNLLQMSCDNCYSPFQNFLRTQEEGKEPVKRVSINMIDEIVMFLVHLKQIGGCILSDSQAMSLVIQAFETLIDSCKGPCIENQILLGKKKQIYKFVNSVLLLYNVNKEAKSLFYSVVRYLEVLLEGSFSLEIAKEMIDFIDFELLAKLAKEIYEDFIIPKKSAFLQESVIGGNANNALLSYIKSLYRAVDSKLPELELEEWELISIGFKITIITVKLREKFRSIEELQWLCFSDEQPNYQGEPILDDIIKGIDFLGGYTESFVGDLKKFSSYITRVNQLEITMNEAYEFYISLISSVEIEKGGKIEKCYFQVPTALVFMNQRMRNSIAYGIDRDSNEEKIKSFLVQAETAQIELNHLQVISRVSVIGWMLSRYEFFAQILFFAIILTNLIVIFTVSSIQDRSYNSGGFPGQVFMIMLGVLIVVISIIMYFLSVLVSYPMIIYKKTHENINLSNSAQNSAGAIQGTIMMNNLIEYRSKDLQSDLNQPFKYISHVILSPENFVNILVIVLALLGWYNPFFYVLLMLDILRRSQTLSNVLLVITKNKRALILTLILTVLLVYIFAVWGFSYMRGYYRESSGDDNYQTNTYCNTLYDCVTSSISLGIRAGGGLGDSIYPANSTDDYYAMRKVFDILFFCVVTVIMLNIFFGIIVDTFAELRDARRQTDYDMENFCLICGKMKNEFELRGSGWNQHIQIEHNMWAYLGYILYIKRKPIGECDGLEKYVKVKLFENDISFFPSTALCLQGDDNEERDQTDMLKEELETIEFKLREISKKTRIR